MAIPQQLRRPPVTEALVDIRIIGDASIDEPMLLPLVSELRDRFPISDVKRKHQAEFRIDAGKVLAPVHKDLGFLGIFVSTEDGTLIAQFRTDGFTFNNVGAGAYVGGDRLIHDALELWERYAQIARPSAVSRVALRFLNRLELPLKEGDEFSTYLRSRFELPEGAPQMVSSFVNRVVAHDANETEATAVVTQKLDRPAIPLPVVIDVDVFYEREFSTSPVELRSAVESLRGLKNRCFFALLTDEAVKLYT